MSSVFSKFKGKRLVAAVLAVTFLSSSLALTASDTANAGRTQVTIKHKSYSDYKYATLCMDLTGTCKPGHSQAVKRGNKSKAASWSRVWVPKGYSMTGSGGLPSAKGNKKYGFWASTGGMCAKSKPNGCTRTVTFWEIK